MRRGLSLPQLSHILWHLPNFARLYWRLFTDHRVPFRARGILIGAALYLFSPVDILPDFLSPLFALDDLVVLIVALRWFIASCPPDVVAEHVRRIDAEKGFLRR